MGPGIITANIDNDASGITTYSVAGARFGYTLLWTLLPTTVALVVIQEMIARMGVITGKGLSDLIRENYGIKAAFFMMLGLLVANFGNTVANLAGWAASMEILGLSKYVMVPVGAVAIWMLVTKGSYRFVEKILLFACLLYFGYVISGSDVETGLDAGPQERSHPSVEMGFRIYHAEHCYHRDDHYSLDAVLSAVIYCGKRDQEGRLCSLKAGRCYRLPDNRRYQFFYNRHLWSAPVP